MAYSVATYTKDKSGKFNFNFGEVATQNEAQAMLVPMKLSWKTFYGLVLLDTNDGQVYLYKNRQDQLDKIGDVKQLIQEAGIFSAPLTLCII
jgi:hypothetical protein